MTSPALWLVRRELAARGKRVALAAAVVAAIAAAVTATELVARAREVAIATQVDAVGPALTLVPRGTTASALARYEIEGVLPSDTEAGVRRTLGWRVRAVEQRIVLHREVAGARRPVIGSDRFAGDEPAVGGGAFVGSELGRTVAVGSAIDIGARSFQVVRALPSTGSVEDFAVFLPISDVRGLGGTQGVNELRVFLAAGVSPRDAEARLAPAAAAAAVIRSDRGDVADRDMHESLARHRGVAYVVMAAVAGLALLIAAHLDATERRLELATFVAIGAPLRTISAGLLARSAVVAGAGAGAGALFGLTIAIAVGPAQQVIAPSTWGLAAVVVVAGVCVGLVAALPTAFWSVARDPVRELQES